MNAHVDFSSPGSGRAAVSARCLRMAGRLFPSSPAWVSALFFCVAGAGCTSVSSQLEISAAHPSIRIAADGVLIGKNYVDPADIPDILDDYRIPKNRVIHILIDPEVERNLKPVRNFMGYLAAKGYTRSVLVTKKRSESAVITEEQRLRRGLGSRSGAGAYPASGGVSRKVRYKGADE